MLRSSGRPILPVTSLYQLQPNSPASFLKVSPATESQQHIWTPRNTTSPFYWVEFSSLCLRLFCSVTMMHNLEKECLNVGICVVSLADLQIRNSWPPCSANIVTRLELHIQSLESCSEVCNLLVTLTAIPGGLSWKQRQSQGQARV